MATRERYDTVSGRKLTVMIVGGLEHRNTLPKPLLEVAEKVHWITQESRSIARRECDAIVLLIRFCPANLIRQAKSLADSMKIPLVRANSVNYIMRELVVHDLVRAAKEEADADVADVAASEPAGDLAPPSAEPPVRTAYAPMTVVSSEDLWKAFRETLVPAVKKLGSPGERIDRKTFFELLSGDTGMSEDQLSVLLSEELQVRGLVKEEGGSVVLLGPGYAYVPPGAREQAPSSSKLAVEAVESDVVRMARLVALLPMDSFPSKLAVARVLPHFSEFDGSAGPRSLASGRHVVDKAFAMGILRTESDGRVVVVHSSSARLVPARPFGEVRPVADASILDDPARLVASLGNLPSVDSRTPGMKALELMVPDAVVDELASREVLERLGIASGLEKVRAAKDSFSFVQWSYLAWERMKGMKLGEVAGILEVRR